VVEGISRAIIDVKSFGSFKGVKIGGTFFLSHILFMYDILIFYDGSRRDFLKLKEILDLYCVSIRMMVNLGKSIIFFVGIEVENVESIKNIFPFKHIEFEEGLKYLGFFLKYNAYFK
jgi:hypothetical protein